MPDIALRPRSATEIVDAAFQVYRREPLQFIVGLGLIYVPWHIVAAILNVDPTDPTGAADLRSVIVVPLAVIVYALASAVTIGMADDVYFGRKADIAGAFRRAARKLGTLLGATFAVGILVGAVGIVAALAAGLLPGVVLRVAVIVAAVVGGIYAAVRMFAIRQTVLLENAGIGASIERSWRLSRDQWAHVAGTLLLAGIIVIVVMVGGIVIAQMIASPIIQSALSAIASILVVPLFGIAETVLYYDTRIRNEGFDVEYLASTVPPPVVAAEQAGA
jgi:hypothetical protein